MVVCCKLYLARIFWTYFDLFVSFDTWLSFGDWDRMEYVSLLGDPIGPIIGAPLPPGWVEVSGPKGPAETPRQPMAHLEVQAPAEARQDNGEVTVRQGRNDQEPESEAIANTRQSNGVEHEADNAEDRDGGDQANGYVNGIPPMLKDHQLTGRLAPCFR